jgi:hypothetical protein
MVASAFRSQIALAGLSVWIGDSVVKIAVNRLGIASGRGTGSRASANEVLEPTAGGVVVLGVAVVTSPLNNGAEGDAQAADQVGQLLGLFRAGRRITATVVNGGLRGFLAWWAA